MPLSNIPRRRAVRAALVLPAAAGLLGGCSEPARPAGASKASPSAAAGEALRKRAAGDSAGLLARYDATIAAHPDLAKRLLPLRAEVARHAQAFGTRVRAASPSASPSGSPSAAASPSVSASSVPTRPGDALSALATAERALADARAAALLDAPPELARLLASVAACGAGHVLLLKEH
ncbi:hypothetical protein [Streptomyces sp. NPDC026673]|uniref:hypothetical protein n=1 Tax=Streptomyces sp. NPDC026673 TaxID=3155724 RepID=UPI0033DC9225